MSEYESVSTRVISTHSLTHSRLTHLLSHVAHLVYVPAHELQGAADLISPSRYLLHEAHVRLRAEGLRSSVGKCRLVQCRSSLLLGRALRAPGWLRYALGTR